MARENDWQYGPIEELPPRQGRRFSAKELELLEEVHCHFGEPAPLHAYAQWLNDRADPLGRFIFLQSEHGRRTPNRFNSAWARFEQQNPEEAELLEQHRRDWVWSLNGMLYLELADFRLGLATDVLFRTDDPTVRRTLEEATTATYDRFLSEVSPLMRFELWLFDTPVLPTLVQHPVTARADVLCIDGLGREPGLFGGYPPGGGVSLSAVRALADCPYLDNMETIFLMGLAPDAREEFAQFVQQHPHAKEQV